MLGFGKSKDQVDLSAEELRDLLASDSALVIDVREPDEFASEHIRGAVNMPLSSFDPAKLPHPAGKTIVLQCAGGKRSGMALDRCRAAEAVVKTHLAGGIAAWKQAGFPLVSGS